MRQSDADLVATLARFPLEAAPQPSPRSTSGKMMRAKVLRALWQQYEAGKTCHQLLDQLILMGRTGHTRPPAPTGAKK